MYLFNCISAKSAAQILPLNAEYTFLFFQFSKIGFMKFFLKFFCLISFFMPLPFVFYRKIGTPCMRVHTDTHIWDF